MLTFNLPLSDPPSRLRQRSVTVHAPGRLHLGFLDPAGTLGRAFGSLGLVIDAFETVVELSDAEADSVTALTPAAQAEVGRARTHLERLRERTGRDAPLELRLLRVLPPHAGFGSGTQLALAIGHAFARWHRLSVDSTTLAGWLGRGRRSGIGIAGFDHGGLLLDGGPAADGAAAPLLSRLALPEAWRVVVVRDTSRQGLSGTLEKQTLVGLPPLPQPVAAEICHQVLMRVLAGAASAEFPAFAAGLTRVQQLLGEHFAPAQGGSAYASAAVGQLVQWLAEAHRGRAPAGEEAAHGAAVGQSSWGPTGFAILPSAAAAEAAVRAVHDAGLVTDGLSLQIVRARNRGATFSPP